MNDLNELRPTEADAAIIDRLSTLSTPDLKRRLTETLNRTVDELKEAAGIVRVLEERGEDMSDLRGSLFNYLRLIAYGQLQAEVVVRFAGSPYLMRNIAALPLPDQKRLGRGDKVEVAVRRGGSFDTRMIAPADMTPDQARQVFAGGRIRSVSEQIATLEATPEPVAPTPARRPSRVAGDARTGTIKVGRETVKVDEVLTAIGDMATIDPDAEGVGGSVAIDADLYEPLKRIASHRGVTLKHLVRLALLRAYFPGDS